MDYFSHSIESSTWRSFIESVRFHFFSSNSAVAKQRYDSASA